MGYLIPIHTQVETKNGEVLVTINLNLNVTLDSEGNMSVEAKANATPTKKEKLPDMNNVQLEKPDIEDNSDIIPFGKQV